MRLFARRTPQEIDRRTALAGVPILNPGVEFELLDGGCSRVSLIVRRGHGLFESMRPKQSSRSYELDEFGTFVVQQIDGTRTVLDVIDAFEKRFQLSRREVELSVVAFCKLLMQRHVLSVTIDRSEAPRSERSRKQRTEKRTRSALTVLAGALLLSISAAAAQGQAADSAAATMDALRTLCSAPRSPGSPANLALEARVAAQFAASGFESGEIAFAAPVLEPGGLELDCGEAGTFSLEAMHPTLMRPGNFPTGEFETRLVYLGRGGPDGLAGARGIDLDDAIAVMEYDCGYEWLDMLPFGVSGFVFLGNGCASHHHAVSKITNSEVAVPRFFLDGEGAERLRSRVTAARELPARATATPSRWSNGEVRDLWVMIPGADEERAGSVVVLTAAIDANAVVPGRAFGAQRAVNLHVLLKLLEDFKEQPPGCSVLLAAVNAHSRLFAGERMLAWHLLADIKNVEELREEMAGEMRLARLYTESYGRLKLDPVAEPDRTDLHVLMEILRQLDQAQQEARETAETAAEGQDATAEPVLDLDAVTEDGLREAIRQAREEMLAGYSSYMARMGRDRDELELEKTEDLAFLDALGALPFPAFMEKARRIKTTFDDEKLFESWRSQMDESTGRRVYVKSVLQDEFKSRLNRTMQEIMIVSSSEKSTLAEADRVARQAELSDLRTNLRKVLVLFNKMDIGVGRSRTYYRQIAVNDTQREMLRSVALEFVEKYARWEKLHEATLRRDTRCGAIRDALGARTVALVLSLDADAHADRVGLCPNIFSNPGSRYNGFGAICIELAEQLADGSAEDNPSFAPYVDAFSSASERKPEYYFSQVYSAAEHLAAAADTPVFAMKSAFADPGRIFGPHDTVDALQPDNVHALQAWMRRFLAAICAHPDALAPDNLDPGKDKGNAWSTHLRSFSLEQFTGKPIPTREVPGSLVAVYRRNFWPDTRPIIDGDVVHCFEGITDNGGNLYIYGVARGRTMAPVTYRMDPDYREVLYTIDKGRVQSSKQITSNLGKTIRCTMPLFECREFVIKDRTDTTQLGAKPITEWSYWPKRAEGQSNPDKYGVHGAFCLSPARSHNSIGPVGVYLYRKRPELKEDRLMVITNSRRCVLNSTEETPEGHGFATPDEFADDFYRQAARDMGYLNRSRNAAMKGVVNQLLDGFLKQGDRFVNEAAERRAANDHTAYLLKAEQALGTQVKAYGEISTMNSDMLKAIVAYMALMLPFCFFLQKLLFHFRRMEHELAGFTLLFVTMYLVFRFIHPAFRMAMSPEAIFIAFVLGAIGVFTTAVLKARFSEQMRLVFQGVGGIGEEAKYSTVGQTAVLIGVQNMRRRRIRTTLTTATIVLVVFTMLAFSSVSRTASPTLIAKSDSAMYNGIFYHWPGGKEMDEASFRAIRNLFAGRATIRARRLLSRQPLARRLNRAEPWRLARADDRSTYIDVNAVTGMPPDDLAFRDSLALVEGATFSSPQAREIILPVSAADALDLSIADVGKARVRLLGHEWLLKGLVSDQRYRLARDLNPNLALVPLRSTPRQQSSGGGDDEDSLEIEIPDLDEAMIDTAGLAIVPDGIAAELGAGVCGVSVVFPDTFQGDDLGEEVRRILAVTQSRFYVGSRAPFKLNPKARTPIKPGVYYVGSSYRTSIGGLSKLIIPLIIAGSIILNTMLGTVYERKSEIAVFNAIGLNPTHIFMFFLAEAFVYSLIGAVGGYLIGQTLAIGLKTAGLITDVNINFSSLMVVYAIAFTMALVMLSTIYPGYVATRAAVPSGKRKWSMPDHDHQSMNVVFPFIYRRELAPGALYYLFQFFDKFSEDALGDIIATLEQVTQATDDAGRPILSLGYNISLAPFDLGVTQRVRFRTQYDEVVRSFRMHMDIERISGQETNWVTTNKPFLEGMRKYLIRWRNIDPTRQSWFVKQAETLFAGAHEA